MPLPERLEALGKLVASSKLPDEWLDEIAQLHSRLLERRDDPATLDLLGRCVSDRSRLGPLRSIAALALGTLSTEGRSLLARTLSGLEGEAKTASWYALALKDVERGASLSQLRAFWLGAVLTVSDEGVISPHYDIVYKNRELGLPLDPGIQAPSVKVDLPTEGFDKYLGTIGESGSKTAALAYLSEHPDPVTLRTGLALLPRGDSEMIATAKQLYARQDVQDPASRNILIAVVGQGRDAAGDLLWMHSIESSADLRSRILSELLLRADQATLTSLVAREVASPSLPDTAATRAVEVLGALKDPAATRLLGEMYTKAASETRKLQIVQALQGSPGGAALLADRVDLLQRVACDSSVQVRMGALRVLANLPIPKDDRKALLNDQLSRESDESIKAYLRETLERK